jgi:hypothetical protein
VSYSVPSSSDHAARGLARFLEQFKSKPNLAALAKSYLNRIQELENAVWEVILFRGLESSEGVQLDKIGRIVGRGRGSLNDDDYRIAIRGQIRINRSCGTPEDLIVVTRLSSPSSTVFSYDELHPATVLIAIIGALDFNIDVLFGNLVRTKSGGVRLFLTWSAANPENTFTFAPGSVPVVDTLKGFGDTSNPATGGLFSGVIASSP